MTRRSDTTPPRRPQAVSRLDVHFCYWLRRASNQVSQALSRKLEDKGITLAEWVVLRELHEGDLRPVMLADRLGLTRGAISRLARRLERNLMITQYASTHNARAQMLAITDGGRIMVRVLASAARALLLSTLRGIAQRRGG